MTRKNDFLKIIDIPSETVQLHGHRAMQLPVGPKHRHQLTIVRTKEFVLMNPLKKMLCDWPAIDPVRL
jgi:hypothetical protein